MRCQSRMRTSSCSHANVVTLVRMARLSRIISHAMTEVSRNVVVLLLLANYGTSAQGWSENEMSYFIQMSLLFLQALRIS